MEATRLKQAAITTSRTVPKLTPIIPSYTPRNLRFPAFSPRPGPFASLTRLHCVSGHPPRVLHGSAKAHPRGQKKPSQKHGPKSLHGMAVGSNRASKMQPTRTRVRSVRAAALPWRRRRCPSRSGVFRRLGTESQTAIPNRRKQYIVKSFIGFPSFSSGL